jgi:hypothetical protein
MHLVFLLAAAATPAAEDLRRPWEKPAEPGRLTPARVRRWFRNIRPTTAGVRLRQVTADADIHRIAAMESTIWGQDCSWLARDLIGRISAAPAEIAVMGQRVATAVSRTRLRIL